MHYIANVKVVIAHEDRYLMEIHSEQDAHASGVLCFAGGQVEDAGVTVGEIVYVDG